MAIIASNTDTRYWKVIDVEALDDGTFDIEAKQVKDKDGTKLDGPAAPRKTINRPNNTLALGTIVKITDVTQTDRTFTVNPTS